MLSNLQRTQYLYLRKPVSVRESVSRDPSFISLSVRIALPAKILLIRSLYLIQKTVEQTEFKSFHFNIKTRI